MNSIEIILRIAGVTVLVFMGVLWLREARRHQSGLMVTLFCYSVASYLLCPPLDRYWQLGPMEWPFFMGCFSVAGFFFLMSRGIFSDRFRFRPWHAGMLFFLVLLGSWHRYGTDISAGLFGSNALAELPLVTHQMFSLGITVSALLLAWQEKAGDLIETRRRFRDVFIGVSGVYILIVLAGEMLLRNQSASSSLEIINVAAILFLAFIFAVAMTQLKPVFEPNLSTLGRPEQSPAADPEAETLKTALKESMEEGAVYRQEGLTIAKLATELGTQEYLLRRLINGTLGFRNFNEFLNAYRIKEVRKHLSDPEFARIPILTIAMDCGYSSLGPFNRAFKEITGQTPKSYRIGQLTRGKTDR